MINKNHLTLVCAYWALIYLSSPINGSEIGEKVVQKIKFDIPPEWRQEFYKSLQLHEKDLNLGKQSTSSEGYIMSNVNDFADQILRDIGIFAVNHSLDPMPIDGFEQGVIVLCGLLVKLPRFQYREHDRTNSLYSAVKIKGYQPLEKKYNNFAFWQPWTKNFLHSKGNVLSKIDKKLNFNKTNRNNYSEGWFYKTYALHGAIAYIHLRMAQKVETGPVVDWHGSLVPDCQDVFQAGIIRILVIDVGDSFLTAHITLKDGSLNGISTISRNGDVNLKYSPTTKVADLDIPIMFDNIGFSYHYHVILLLIGPQGTMIGQIQNCKVFLCLSFDFNSYVATVKKLQMMDSGHASVTFVGGVIELVIDILSEFLSVILHPFIIAIIQGIVQNVSKLICSTVNDAIDGKFVSPDEAANVTKLNQWIF